MTITNADEIVYDDTPPAYVWDTSVSQDIAVLNRVHMLLSDFSNMDFGRNCIPRIYVSSYLAAHAARRALGMKSVVKHNCKHSVTYSGFTQDGDEVLVVINRNQLCELEYVQEEVTEMVIDPDWVAPEPPMVEVTHTVTRTVYNCADAGDDDA